MPRLREFWRKVEQGGGLGFLPKMPFADRSLPNLATVFGGINGFFAPNPWAFLGMPMSPDSAGYYTTRPLEKTLSELVDFVQSNAGAPRITVGAADVTSSQMRYFDSRDMPLDARHIMASGALPPAFPAVRIDGKLYWDGGILSNTPVEAIFDDKPRRNSLVLSVHIWNPDGSEPTSIKDVMNRQKDVQYASRTESHIQRQKQLHRLRHVIAELAMKLPPAERETSAVKELAAYGCLTTMHVVRLLAPTLASEDHTKDIDFTPEGIAKRWQAGLDDTRRLLEQAPWEEKADALEGFVLHEVRRDTTDMSIRTS